PFRRYFFLIGPFSRLIRRMMLHHVARELGTPELAESTMPLAGDAFVPSAMATHTDAITIEAPPERVWPWLLQMGGDRAGWYSWDALDHGGMPSAREIDPRLAHLSVGDLLHALPDAKDGFRVLAIEPERALVLGNAIDLDTDRTLSPSDPMPPHHWRS